MEQTSRAGRDGGGGARRRFALAVTPFQERCAEIALLGSRRAPLVNVPGGDVTSEARVAPGLSLRRATHSSAADPENTHG